MTNNPVRQYGHWLWVALVVMALLVPGPASAAETVTVTGVSFYEPGREALARDKALEEAKRTAIEQALGARVESRTVVENFEVTRDQVMSHASGYLRDIEILREGKTELGTYEVELRATVEIGALVADMDRFRKILGWQKNPRVAVVLPPDLDPSYRSAARRAANRLSSQLKREGFRLYEASASGAPELGLVVSLDLELSSSESSYQGVALTLHEVGLTVSVQRPVSGEVLGTSSAVKSLPGANRLQVLDKGAQQCIQAVWKDLRRQLTRLWEQELYGQREIDLVVHNVRDHAHAAEVAAVLKSDVSSVADISLLRFADGTAEYGVQYRGWPEHLANELQMAYFRNRYFGSTLDSINGNKLVIRID